MTKKEKTIFSGMQATGIPTIGNYLGAIRHWPQFQDEYNSFFCIVDMHSITVRQDPVKLRQQSRKLLMTYIACGLDPEKSTIFYQSHVPAHGELSWILSCYTYMGELNRMTQFKDKSAQNPDNINAGLFTYPVLMAADILLYQTDLVPVGEDQTQHLELTRDIARRFNTVNGDTFTVPKGYFGKTGQRIMKLQDPTSKMSKSEKENLNNAVFLLDEPNVARNKIKRAVTDSGSDIYFDLEEKPGVSNLLSIYAAFKNISIEEAENFFKTDNYGTLKGEVGELVASELEIIQKRILELEKDKEYVDRVIREGAMKASIEAEKTLRKVKRRIGFPDKIK